MKPPSRPATRPWRRRILGLGATLLSLSVAVGVYQARFKPLPAGISISGPGRSLDPSHVEFLADVTRQDGERRISEQKLFDRAFQMIASAEEVVVADLFLFNDWLGAGGKADRPLSAELTQALVQRKRERPGLQVVVITDPVNEAYGGAVSPHFTQLRTAGIPVVVTRLQALRDSNPVWSAPWRIGIQWFGTSPGGVLPHPFSQGAPGIGLRSWFSLLNFKANHRKVLVVDQPAPGGGRELAALVMSANPHDGSSAHGNLGLIVRGQPALDLLQSEQAVLDLSGSALRLEELPTTSHPDRRPPQQTNTQGVVEVRILTEGKIRKALLADLYETRAGDAVDVAMFYLSDRAVVGALIHAAQRDVRVRLLLDPNRDAFGHRKTGVPNRPVAAELVAKGGSALAVRWYDTHGEQFHSKMVLIRQPSRHTLYAGSANLTRRNVGDFNLETDLRLQGPTNAPALRDAHAYFERLWGNDGARYSLDYDAYADRGKLKHWQYRFQEATGIGSF